MAVGETAGQPGRRVISAGGGRRRKPDGEAVPATGEGAPETDEDAPAKPLLGEADPELERLLQEEEDINRRIRQQHETPHFREGQD
jgi:small subunit ribosomal protein S3